MLTLAGGSVVGAGFALSRDGGRRLAGGSVVGAGFGLSRDGGRRLAGGGVVGAGFAVSRDGGRRLALQRCWRWFRAHARCRSEAPTGRTGQRSKAVRAGQKRGPGAPRRAFTPTPGTGAGRRGPGLLFPATIPPGRRGVAQSGRAPGSGSGGRRFKSCRPDAARPPDGFCQTGSARRVLPDGFCQTGSARRVLPDGFCQTGSARWVLPDGFCQTGSSRRIPAPRRSRRPALSDAFLPALSHPGIGGHFGTHPWFKTCIFRRSCRRQFVPAGALFLALAS